MKDGCIDLQTGRSGTAVSSCCQVHQRSTAVALETKVKVRISPRFHIMQQVTNMEMSFRRGRRHQLSWSLLAWRHAGGNHRWVVLKLLRRRQENVLVSPQHPHLHTTFSVDSGDGRCCPACSQARRWSGAGRATLFSTGRVEGVPKGALPQHGPHQDLHESRRAQTPLTHASAPG